MINRESLKTFKLLISSFLGLFFVLLSPSVSASEEKQSERFNASEMIVHHIKDAHEWHIATFGHSHLVLPLPVILYSTTRGLVVFMSGEFHHHENGEFDGYILDAHDHIVPVDKREKVYDFSVTKNVASMGLSAILLVVVFVSVGASAKKNYGKAPKGIQSFFEPIVVFIRDDVAIPNLGNKYHKYFPYLLTVFFFIWINNMLGLLPASANVTGNIAVTMTLAVITAIITNFSGNASYWSHIFWTPGVPLPLRFIMLPVELIGIITKPFALMIRLFANITAGHIIILSIVSFIFIFQNAAVGLVSVPFALVMNLLEVFVAALQAYIFTLLSALYIGQAIAEHEHNDHH